MPGILEHIIDQPNNEKDRNDCENWMTEGCIAVHRYKNLQKGLSKRNAWDDNMLGPGLILRTEKEYQVYVSACSSSTLGPLTNPRSAPASCPKSALHLSSHEEKSHNFADLEIAGAAARKKMRQERKRKEPLSLTRPSICLNHLRNIKAAASHLCCGPPWLHLVGPRILRTPQNLVGPRVLGLPSASSSVKSCLLGLDGEYLVISQRLGTAQDRN